MWRSLKLVASHLLYGCEPVEKVKSHLYLAIPLISFTHRQLLPMFAICVFNHQRESHHWLHPILHFVPNENCHLEVSQDVYIVIVIVTSYIYNYMLYIVTYCDYCNAYIHCTTLHYMTWRDIHSHPGVNMDLLKNILTNIGDRCEHPTMCHYMFQMILAILYHSIVI